MTTTPADLAGTATLGTSAPGTTSPAGAPVIPASASSTGSSEAKLLSHLGRSFVVVAALAGGAGVTYHFWPDIQSKIQSAYNQLTGAAAQSKTNPAPTPAPQAPKPVPAPAYDDKAVKLGPGYWLENAVLDNYFGSKNLTTVVNNTATYNGISAQKALVAGQKIKIKQYFGEAGTKDLELTVSKRGDLKHGAVGVQEGETVSEAVHRAYSVTLNRVADYNKSTADTRAVVRADYAEQQGLEVTRELGNGYVVARYADGLKGDEVAKGKDTFVLPGVKVRQAPKPAASAPAPAPQKSATPSSVKGASLESRASVGGSISDPSMRAAYSSVMNHYAV